MTVSVEVTNLDQKQREFLEKYLLKRKMFSGKRDARVEEDFKRYLQTKTKVHNLVWALPMDTPEQLKKALAFEKRIEDNHNAIKGKGKDSKKLATAKQGLVTIESDLNIYVKELEKSAHEASPAGQVALYAADAKRTLGNMAGTFELREAEVMEELKKIGAKTGTEIPGDLDYSKRVRKAQAAAVLTIGGFAKKTVEDVEAAKSGIDTAVKGFKDTHGVIAKELEDFAKDTSKMEDYVAALRRCKVLEGTLTQIGNLADEIDTWGVPAAKGILAEIPKIRGRVDPTNQDLDGLEKEVQSLLVKTRSERNARIQEYKTRAALLEKRLNEVWTQAEIYNKGSKKGVKIPQVEEASFLISMARDALRTGKNLDALGPVEKMIDDAAKVVFDLKNITIINKTVEDGIKNAKKVIGTYHGKKGTIRVEAWKGHLEAITEFEGNWVEMRPAAARSKIIDFGVKLKTEEETEASQQQWRTRQLTRIDAAETELAKIETAVKELIKALKRKGEKMEPYGGTLRQDIDLCKEWVNKEALSWQAPTETKIGQVQQEIVAMVTKLEGRGREATDPNKTAQQIKLEAEQALVKEYDEIRQGKSDEERRKQSFINMVEDWLVIAKQSFNSSTSKDTYKDEFKTLIKQAKDVQKRVKKGELDVTGAQKLHGDHDQRLDDLLKRPVKIDRKKLAQLGKAFGPAVKNLADKAAELSGKVKEVDATAAGKLQGQLNSAVGEFRKTAFDEPAAVLGSESTTESQRKRAREQALAAVRAERDRMMKDQLIRACVSNPFRVASFTSDVYRALNDIEREVLRGV